MYGVFRWYDVGPPIFNLVLVFFFQVLSQYK